MQSQITLLEAVHRIYGNKLERIRDITSSWYQLQPFRNINTKQILYFKILKIPNQNYTSEGIYKRAVNHYHQIIHQCDLIFVERNFIYSFYLLQSQSNVISLARLLQLRQDCNEKVQVLLIYKIVEFLGIIFQKQYCREIQIDIKKIGMNPNGNFKVCDYQLYFSNHNINDPKIQKQKLLDLLSSIVNCTYQPKTTNIQNLYLDSLTNYDLSLANFLQQFIELDQITKKKVGNLVNKYLQNPDQQLTVGTDSFIEKVDLKEDIEVLHGSFTQSLIKNTNKKSEISRSKFSSIITGSFFDSQTFENFAKYKKATIFLIIFVLITAIAFILLFTLVLTNHGPKCEQGQYIDINNKCMSCSYGCERCKNGQQDQCFSCKGNWFLILQYRTDEVGICDDHCRGSKIRDNVCVLH